MIKRASMLSFYIKNIIYVIVFNGYIICHAGSYDDFFTAIERNDAGQVKSLLERGFDPNTPDPNGLHGLLLAVKANSNATAELLINWPKTKVESRNAADESPLMLAALTGNLQLCRLLIGKDADVNKPGWAPLHYAATKGHIDVIRLLLDENAYIDAASPNGSTPLMMAAHYGSAAAVKLLLESGADPTLKNDLGLSAIDFANRGNRLDAANIIAAFIRGRQPKGTW